MTKVPEKLQKDLTKTERIPPAPENSETDGFGGFRYSLEVDSSTGKSTLRLYTTNPQR